MGFDPGVETGWCAVFDNEQVIACGCFDLRRREIAEQAEGMVLGVRTLVLPEYPPTVVVVEDVTAAAAWHGDGRRRDPRNTAVLNRVYGMLLAAIAQRWPGLTKTVPVLGWYPRGIPLKSGETNKKAVIRYLRSRAGLQGNMLRNEHITMAYGLARHGAMRWGKVVSGHVR